MKKRFARRTFLRGAAGGLATLVALPPLEGMFRSDRAFAQATGQHARFVGFYVPNGTIEERWFPARGSSSRRDFSLQGTALAPLERHRANLSLFRGMHNAGKPGSGNAHMRAIAAFLTGAAIPNDAVSTFRVSMDQYIADHYQQQAPTRVHSLQLAGNMELDPPNNNRYNNRLKNALCFDREGRILPNTSDLRSVFNRLFEGFDPGGADRAALRRSILRTSVLDEVQQDREALLATLGNADRSRLEEYFESLRSLERRLEPATQPTCELGDAADFPRYDDGRRQDEIGDHARRAAELMGLAFRCDLTRVATYMAGGEAAGCRYNDIDIGVHFHNTISHNRNGRADEHHRIDRFHSELVAHLLDVLEATPHGEGTLLDGTAVLYGAGLGNGDRHSHDDVSLLLAGRIGNVRQGTYHLDVGGQNHNRVLLSVLREMGIPAEGFGDNDAGQTVDLTG